MLVARVDKGDGQDGMRAFLLVTRCDEVGPNLAQGWREVCTRFAST